MGNSEVGHLNIGAGRIVYQDLTRISKAIEDKAKSLGAKEAIADKLEGLNLMKEIYVPGKIVNIVAK